MSLLMLLLVVIVAVCLGAALWWFIRQTPIPQLARAGIMLAVILIFGLWLLGQLGVGGIGIEG